MKPKYENLFRRPRPPFIEAAAALDTMPPLPHGVPDVPYDVTRSETARWIAAQPAVLEALFRQARESGRIVFDPAARTWRGRTFGAA